MSAGADALFATDRLGAVNPVHLAGQPADLDRLLEHGLPVLEDAAHAVESVYRGRKIGSISDANGTPFIPNMPVAFTTFAVGQDLYNYGTAASIMRMLKMPDGRIRILVQGLARASVTRLAPRF